MLTQFSSATQHRPIWQLRLLAVLLAAMAAPAFGSVTLHSSARYYQDTNGKPLFLIGYYGWASVPDGYYIDHPSRYASAITQGAPYKINYIRISLGVNRMTSSTNPPSWNGTPTPVPFLYVNNKADLNQWDPVFWNGLKAQCQLARDNGVIVHISIFDGVEIRSQGGESYGYANSFWNPSNQAATFYANPDSNGNGQIDDSGEFYQLSNFNNNAGIGHYQKRLIDKVTSELAAYDNVFYETGNELLASDSAWNAAVISYVKTRTSSPVSGCEGGRATNIQGWAQHEADTPAEVKSNVAAIVGAGYPAWEDPDGPALSNANVSADDLRRAAWYSFVGGAAAWGGFTVDYWSGGRGFWVPTVTYYRNLESFIDSSGVKFWEMTPQHSLVGNSSENSCLAETGSEYLVYVLNDPTVTINLSGATGAAYYRTYDPRTAVLSSQQTVAAGGTVTFNKPSGADDWVVYVTSTPSIGWNTLGTQQTIGSGQMPAVATDALGNIHVIYLTGSSVQYKKYDSAMNLLATETIASAAAYWPHIMCDSNNIPHMVYTEYVDPNMPYARYCYYTNRIGGSWKTPVTAISLPSSENIWYPRLALWGSYAYIGCQYGNGADSIGKIVRLTNLSGTPSVDRSTDTATRSCIAMNSAGQLFAPGRNGGAGTYCQQYDSSLNAVGSLQNVSSGAGKPGGSTTAWADNSNAVHMVAWAIEAGGSFPCNDRCGMTYNNTGRRNPDGSYPICIQGLLEGAAGTGPDGNEPSGFWNDDVAPVIAVDATGTVYIAWRGWTSIGEGMVTKVDNSGFTQACFTDPNCGGNTCTGTQFCTRIARRRWWNCEMAPAVTGGVYIVWEDNGTVFLRPVGVTSGGTGRPIIGSRPVSGPMTIDGSPSDWNLSEFTTVAHAGRDETGDIALTGYDGGTLYCAGWCTTATLPTSAADHTARVYSRYDSTYVYFLVRCDDSDIRYPYGVDMNWANDCVEFYVDPAHDHGSSAIGNSSSDIQLVIDANNQKNVYMCTDSYRNSVLAGVTSAVVRDAAGWCLEVRIAKSSLDPDLPPAGDFGIDFNFRDNDSDNDPTKTTIYTWSDYTTSGGFPGKIPDRWGSAAMADTVPPGPVTTFTAVAGPNDVTLSWTDPVAIDFAGVRIVCSTTSYPSTPSDGTVVYNGAGTSCVHSGLNGGTTYCYAAFAYDEVPNYASAVTASATPTNPYCFSDSFSYADGNLNGNGGWSGSAAAEIAVDSQRLKIIGGAGSCDSIQALAFGASSVGVRLRVRKGSGTSSLWSLWIDDSMGRNYGRWFGTGSVVRGRIGSGSQVTSAQNLTGNWDDLHIKVTPSANQTQFIFNGSVIGTYSHTETGAGETIGRIRIERSNSSAASGQYVYLDDVSVGSADTAPPTATIGGPLPLVTETGPVAFEVTFSEPVFGFSAASDVEVDSSMMTFVGAVGITGSGAGPYTVALSLSGIQVEGLLGTLDMSVKSAACVDAAGNANTASAPSRTCSILAQDGSIYAASRLPPGTQVALGNKALCLRNDSFAYIEEIDRRAGVRLEGMLLGASGDLVCLVGTRRTGPFGEPYVDVTAMARNGQTSVAPVGASNRNAKTSLMNGLLINTWGIVKMGTITSSSYVISDGSDDSGIRVMTQGVPEVVEGQFVIVTGAAGLEGERVIYRR